MDRYRLRKKRKNLKMYKKKDFALNKFVDRYYMEKEAAYITVYVESIDDIISFYAIKDYEWINDDLADYLEEQSYYIPVEEQVIIEFTGARFNDYEKQVIEKTIKTYFGLKLGDKIIDLNQNTKKIMFLCTSGLILFIIATFIMKMNIIESISELILVFLWFFIWEFIDTVVFERKQLLNDKLEAGQLSSAKIVFTEDD